MKDQIILDIAQRNHLVRRAGQKAIRLSDNVEIIVPDDLSRQNSGFDFYEVAVWNVKKALEEAFEAGRKSNE